MDISSVHLAQSVALTPKSVWECWNMWWASSSHPVCHNIDPG